MDEGHYRDGELDIKHVLMKTPPCKYPKQPTGPSGFGASGVRRGQSAGGDYQRTRPDQDTLSIMSGDFSRVIIEGVPEYLSAGVDGSLIQRDTRRHQQSFIKSIAKVEAGAVSISGGQYAKSSSEYANSSTGTSIAYSYEIKPGVFEDVTFQIELFYHEILFTGYYSGEKTRSFYNVFYTYLSFTPGQIGYVRARDSVLNWGVSKEDGRCAVSAGTSYFGRVDSVGRELHDVLIYRTKQKNQPVATVIIPELFTREDAEFCWLIPTIVLKDYTVSVLAELFFRPGVAVPGTDYRPKFWMAATPNNGSWGTSLEYNDMTGSIFGDARYPTPTVTDTESFYGATAGRRYQTDLSVTMNSMGRSVVAVGDSAFVLAWQQRMETGWRQRVARCTVMGGIVSASLTYESADTPIQSEVPYWQSVIHLGEGVVLAKVASGWPGIDHGVSFRKSLDGGATWGGSFTPIGFESPALNQYYGDMVLHTAKDGIKKAKILIPSWCPETSAYHVYSSDDEGAIWKRRGKIYKPSEFQRIDSMEAYDGGGNFEVLLPGPSTTRLPDPSLPNRYKDRP